MTDVITIAHNPAKHGAHVGKINHVAINGTRAERARIQEIKIDDAIGVYSVTVTFPIAVLEIIHLSPDEVNA